MCMRTNTLLIVIFTLSETEIISGKDKKTFEGCLLSTDTHSVVVRSFFFFVSFFSQLAHVVRI